MGDFAWTEERVDQLKLRWADGQSAAQIAAEFGGLSRSAVLGKINRLGLHRARTPKGKPWIEQGVSERTWQRRKHTVAVRPPQARREVIEEFDWSGLLPPDQSEHPLTIMDLENCHCRWPLAGEPSISMLFCADPTADVVNGRPYCGRHAAIASQKRYHGIPIGDRTAVIGGFPGAQEFLGPSTESEAA